LSSGYPTKRAIQRVCQNANHRPGTVHVGEAPRRADRRQKRQHASVPVILLDGELIESICLENQQFTSFLSTQK
jgi:predicted thioredoxin/glutaredoxin